MAVAISAAFILAGLISLTAKGGPRYGIDFAGGMVVQMKFAGQTATDRLMTAVEGSGLPGLVVQRLGADSDNEFMVRTSAADLSSEVVRDRLAKSVESGLGAEAKYEIKRMEMVGPKVGRICATPPWRPCSTPSWSSPSTSLPAVRATPPGRRRHGRRPGRRALPAAPGSGRPRPG